MKDKVVAPAATTRDRHTRRNEVALHCKKRSGLVELSYTIQPTPLGGRDTFKILRMPSARMRNEGYCSRSVCVRLLPLWLLHRPFIATTNGTYGFLLGF